MEDRFFYWISVRIIVFSYKFWKHRKLQISLEYSTIFISKEPKNLNSHTVGRLWIEYF